MEVGAKVFPSAKLGTNRPHELGEINAVQFAKRSHGRGEHVPPDSLGKAQPLKREVPHDLPANAVKVESFRGVTIPARDATGEVRERGCVGGGGAAECEKRGVHVEAYGSA